MMRVIAAASSLFVGSALLRYNIDRDVDQFLQVDSLVEDDTCEGGWHAVHPSITFKPASKNMVVAFKGLCIRKHEKRASWHSSLLLGEVIPQALRNASRKVIEWESLEVAPDPRFVKEHQEECTFPSLDLVSGVEDTRLVRTKNGLYAVVSGFHLLEVGADAERPACGKQGILLHASKVESVQPAKFGQPVMMTYPGMGRIEKPWAMFTTPDLEGAETRAVHSVYPHTIIKADLDTGSTQFEHHTFSKALEKMARRYKTRPGNFHGGSAVAHVKQQAGADYFLSIMHTLVKKNGTDVYWSFPYKFSFDAPYGITHVGKRLPLKLLASNAYGEMVARATTVVFDQGDVFIAYSAGDQSSRTFRMPLPRFEREYFDKATSHPEPKEGASNLVSTVEALVLDSEIVELDDLDQVPGCSDPNFVELCSDRLSTSVCRRSCADA